MAIVNSQTHENPRVNSVRVYGIIREPKEIGYEEIIKNIESDFSDAENGDTVRMVAGELDCDIYNKAGASFEKYHEEKDLRYEIIASPIIAGCPESMIVNLAAEGVVDFYLARARRRLHYRITGNRILRGEFPHSPIESNRIGYTIDVRKFRPEEKERGIFAIGQRIKDFEAMKMFSDHVPPDEIKECVVVLPREQIKEISRVTEACGRDFGLLSIDRILRIQQELFS